MGVRIDSRAEAISEIGLKRNTRLEAYFRKVFKKKHEEWLSSLKFDYSSIETYSSSSERIREHLIKHGLGGWPERPESIKAREEHLGDLEPGALYRVSVEVLPEVEMPALLLIPHGCRKKPSPAVICQHGFGGSPEWVMGFGTSGETNYMNSYGHRLASSGFIVLAPQIVCSPPGVGKDRVRLDRLARLGGGSLLGFEMFELSRMVDYLSSRPEVSSDRIGMYGISQGGKSSLFAAACDERIRVAVCSCYFNKRFNKLIEGEWLRQRGEEEKLGYVDYLSTGEDNVFNPWAAPLWPDHVLAGLICPRPFMAEVGRYDPVVYWRDAVEEFELVREIYRKLGLDERACISVSQWGEHEIFYDDAKAFLTRWLAEKLF